MVLADKLSWYLVEFNNVICESVFHSRIIWNVAVFRYKTYYLFGVESNDFATTFCVLKFVNEFDGTALLVEYKSLDHRYLVGCMVNGLVFDIASYISNPIPHTKISTTSMNSNFLAARKCCVENVLYDFYPIKCSDYKREVYNLPIMVICDDESGCGNRLCRQTTRYDGVLDNERSIYDLVFNQESCFRNVDSNLDFYRNIIVDEEGAMLYRICNQQGEGISFHWIKYFTCSYIFSSLENVDDTGVDKLPVITKKLSSICSNMLNASKISILLEFKELLNTIICAKEYNENDFSSTQAIKNINSFKRNYTDITIDVQNMDLNEQRVLWIKLDADKSVLNPLIPTVYIDSYFGFPTKYRDEVEQMLKKCNGEEFEFVYCISPLLDLDKLKFISCTYWNNYCGGLKPQILKNKINVCTEIVAKHLAYELDRKNLLYQVVQCGGTHTVRDFFEIDAINKNVHTFNESKYDCKLIVCNCENTSYLNRMSQIRNLYSNKKDKIIEQIRNNGFNFCFTNDEPSFTWTKSAKEEYMSIQYNLVSKSRAPKLNHPGYKLFVQIQKFVVELVNSVLTSTMVRYKREAFRIIIEQFLLENNHHEICEKIKNDENNVYVCHCINS